MFNYYYLNNKYTMMKGKQPIVFLLFCLTINLSFQDEMEKPKPTPTPYHDWDYLLYSQRWPLTACSEWEEESQNNKCELPQDKTIWTVHGIWPTKIGKDGPFSCPSAIHFDPSQLDSMMNDLKERWTNVEASTKPDSFWKHEWDKHGTCASSLSQLNSVTNYFKQGLEWNKKFELSTILSQGKIVPNSDGGYEIDVIYNAVKNEIKKNPTVQCVIDRKTKESLISEIRICVDKNLEIMDCPNHTNTSIITNCSSKKPVIYLADMPSTEKHSTTTSYNQYEYDQDMIKEYQQNFIDHAVLAKWYSMIKFLIWYTL